MEDSLCGKARHPKIKYQHYKNLKRERGTILQSQNFQTIGAILSF